MIDLHTHILPGVDDGADTEDESVEFVRMALRDGVRTIVATPHCNEGSYFNQLSDIQAGVRRLQQRLIREDLELELVPGAEVHLCPDLVERVRDGRAPTLGNNGKTLLLELSLTQYPVELANLIFQLKLAGLEILLAHPERIRYFQEDRKRYEDVVRIGAYGQITAGSILGTFGKRARAYSEELLREGLIHVVASDAHSLRGRPPVLTPAIEQMIPLVGEQRARSMADGIPRALVAGKTPDVPPVDGAPARHRSFLSRLFRNG